MDPHRHDGTAHDLEHDEAGADPFDHTGELPGPSRREAERDEYDRDKPVRRGIGRELGAEIRARLDADRARDRERE